MITICSISARVKAFVVIGIFDDEVNDQGIRPVMVFLGVFILCPI